MGKLMVKAGRVSNLTDARYFSAMGVDWMGFNLNPAHPGYLSLSAFQDIREWIAGPGIIAEIGRVDHAQFEDLHQQMQMQNYQCHALSPVSDGAGGVRFWREIIVEEASASPLSSDQLSHFQPENETLILNLRRTPDPVAVLRQLQEDHPLAHQVSTGDAFLSLDVPTAYLSAILEEFRPKGIEVIGGSEEKVGYKSFDALDAVFESIENID